MSAGCVIAAIVLTVPNRTTIMLRTMRPLAMVATLLAALALSTIAGAQPAFADIAAMTAFQRAADSYAFLHRQVERRIGIDHERANKPRPIDASELAAAIVAERLRIDDGMLFKPAVVDAFRDRAAAAVHAGCDAGELRTGVWEMRHAVHSPATGSHPIPDCMAVALPRLPEELQYRAAGTVLLLVDSHANLVVDVLPALLAGSELR
jgi:hypothetical protein